MVGDTSFRGTFVVYDWDTKEIIWRENWGEMVNMSAGYCFADDQSNGVELALLEAFPRGVLIGVESDGG